MKRKFKFLLYLLLNVYTIGLISRADLFLSNLSGISRQYYIFELIMGLIMVVTYGHVIKTILTNKDFYLFIFSIILAVYLPYIEDNSILMNLHIISCYLGFGLLNYCLLKTVYSYRIYSLKKFRLLMLIYVLSMTGIFGIYTYSLCVNGLMEIIFLMMISLIFGIIEYDL